jgi:phage gpG-like protein
MDFGVKIEVDRNDLAAVSALVSGLSDFDAEPLVAEICRLGEEQTAERIRNGGPGPDGEAWPPNLEGTQLLIRSGNLIGSIASNVSGTSGEWGAGAKPYAHVHQCGAVITPKDAERLSFMLRGKRVFAKKVTIPARPFVGVSAEDAEEIKEIVTDYLGRLLP